MSATSTRRFTVVCDPADRCWGRTPMLMSQVINDTLAAMDLHHPTSGAFRAARSERARRRRRATHARALLPH